MHFVWFLLIAFIDWAAGQSSGDLRLVRNGLTSNSYTSGRLEVYYSGRWGTVCDDGWTSTNTRVACRQLGFSGAASFITFRTSSAAGFGTVSGTIWLDNVVCSGTESRLTSCRRNSYGVHDCTHSEDVAIYCSTPASGDLRLVRNGFASRSYTSGRLEVYYSGRWGTVCNDYWTRTNSDVACRQLGFPGAATLTSYRTSLSAGYGIGTGTIWLDNVRCSGIESRLTSCLRNAYGAHNCYHFEDVAIYCRTTSVCSSTQFRCTNGRCISTTARCTGVRTCSDGSDERNCLTCSSGGFRCNNLQCVRSSDRCDGTRDCTDGSDEIGCSCRSTQFQCANGQCISASSRCGGIRTCSDGSDERNCLTCSSRAFRCNNLQCVRSSDRCDGTRDCTDGSDEFACPPRSGDLRLVRNGVTHTSYASGRLEVYYSGQWGTVCDDGWTSTNTRVACRQLGFSTSGARWTTSSAGGYGSTTRPILLDNVRCSGTESRLISCRRNSIGSHNCVHLEDVAINCPGGRVSAPVGRDSAHTNTPGMSVIVVSVGVAIASYVLFVTTTI